MGTHYLQLHEGARHRLALQRDAPLQHGRGLEVEHRLGQASRLQGDSGDARLRARASVEQVELQVSGRQALHPTPVIFIVAV